MMLPASTCSPPNFLTPSRLDSESRPLRVLPPAFLCAISHYLRGIRPSSAGGDAGDLDLGEILPMALRPPVILATMELHDFHLARLPLGHDGGLHLAALEVRLADADVVPVADQENPVELDTGAFLGVQLLDTQDSALADPVLFSACGDHGVHGCSHKHASRPDWPGESRLFYGFRPRGSNLRRGNPAARKNRICELSRNPG